MTVSVPQKRCPMPMETDAFQLHDHLPELGLHRHPYCAVSRMILQPSYRTGLHSLAILERLTEKAKALGCYYVFGEMTYAKARIYRMSYKKLGYDFIIHKEISVPRKAIYGHYESLDLIIGYADLRPFYDADMAMAA